MKNKIKLLLNNKKILGSIIIAIILIIIIIALITTNINKGDKLICTKNQEFVKGIVLDEKTIVTIKDNKIHRISIDKTISLDNYYQQFDTYRDSIFNYMNDAYQYLDKKSYKVEKDKESITVKVDVKKVGVILNNLEITRLNETSRDDLGINSSKNIESSSSTFRINDEYKIEDLKTKLEGIGYKCKS